MVFEMLSSHIAFNQVGAFFISFALWGQKNDKGSRKRSVSYFSGLLFSVQLRDTGLNSLHLSSPTLPFVERCVSLIDSQYCIMPLAFPAMAKVTNTQSLACSIKDHS